MAKYNISFTGRQTGAIGIVYPIKDTYMCENLNELKSLIYEDYEHISNLVIKQGSNSIQKTEFDKAEFVKVRSNKERERNNGSYLYTRSNSILNN